MKKLIPILLLILPLLHGIGFAQNSNDAKFYFHYDTKATLSFINETSKYSTNPSCVITLYFRSGKSILLVEQFGTTPAVNYGVFSVAKNDSVLFTYNDPPINYTIKLTDGNKTIDFCNNESPTPISFNNCTSNYRDNYKFGSCNTIVDYSSGAYFKWNISAKLPNDLNVATTSDNLLYTLTKKTLNASPTYNGYSADFYHWEYSTDPNLVTWVPFPASFQNSTSVSVSASDLLGSDVFNHVGQNIFIRLNPPCGSSNSPSNILTFEIVPSPPGITLDTTRTTCSYNSDGKATLTLDRPLVAGTTPNGESLVLTLDSINSQNVLQAVASYQPFFKDLVLVNGKYTYTLNNLKPANYSLIIQEQYKDPTVNPPISVQGSPTTQLFTIKAPTPVTFMATVGNKVYCNGGSDGTINLNASGGAGHGYKYTITPATTSCSTGCSFKADNTQVITGLLAGTYSIQVYDDNGCYAKDNAGKIITASIEIKQPANPLQIALSSKSNPLAYGSNDGKITVNVTGGTPNSTDGSYNYTLTDKSGNSITSNITTTTIGSIFQIIMDKLPDGQYTLNVSDANYTTATNANNGGCSALGNYTLTQPPKLIIKSVEVKQSIQCFGDNNGSFIIHGSGGNRFSGNSPYIYSWKLQNSPHDPIIQTDSLITGLSAGNYALNIKDANGIVLATDSLFTLGQPSLLSVQDSTHTDIACFGGYGSITTTITGGTGNYYYRLGGNYSGKPWILFPNNSKQLVLPGLSSGSYYLDIKDANNCQLNSGLLFTINSPTAPLTITNIASTDPKGYGRSDGSISATVSGGTPNQDGSYNLSLTNANGETISLNNTNLNTSIDGDNNYQVTINNLPDGTYTLTASDHNYAIATPGNNSGCTYMSAPQKLTQPPPLVVKIEEKSEVLCSGDATASLVVHGIGGIRFPSVRAPYNYTWSKSDGNGNFNVLKDKTDSLLTGLSAGAYSVNIQDANGIILTKDSLFTISQPMPVQVDTTHTNVYCFGGADGTITLNANGGVGKYQYMLKQVGKPAGTWLSFSNNSKEVISGLTAGNYLVSIRDGNQCLPRDANGLVITNYPITISQPAKALIGNLINQTNPTGYGLSNGSITSLVNGGTPKADGSYNYSWTLQDGTPVNNNITTSLVSNGYQIKLDNIPDGTYIITVDDSNNSNAINKSGCIYTSTFIVKQPPPLTARIEAQNQILCSGDASGSLIVHGTGGVRFPSGRLPYNYTWKRQAQSGIFEVINNQADSLLTGLSTGNYAINIQDANGIVLANDTLYLLNQPSPIHVDTAHTNVYCFGGNDGTITLNASGGVENYQYMIKLANAPDAAWIPFSNNSVQVINNLIAGNYLVSIRDGNQCLPKNTNGVAIPSFPITVLQPSAPLLANLVDQTNPSAMGKQDGSITLLINGGTPKTDGSYNYSWALLDGTPVTNNITTNVISGGYQLKLANIPTGTYVVTITDGNSTNAINNAGCIYIDTFKVVPPPPLVVKLSIKDQIYCFGDPAASLVANVTGGVPYKTGKPYNYIWKIKGSDGNYTILSNQTDNIASKLIAGYYAFNITDSKGITLAQDSTIYISQPPLLQVSITSQALSCSGVADANAVANVTGGQPPYTYFWNTGDATSSIGRLTAGTYLVVVKDANGCLAQQNVVIAPPDAISISVDKINPTCNNGNDGQIIITATGKNQPYTYKWLNSSNTNNYATNLTAGYYTVLITDANGCSLTHIDTLTNPPALPLSIKPNRFICPNQSFAYDITINNPNITYQWTSDNGFSSSQPKVNLTQPGTYYAMVMDKNGCFAKDTLVLKSGGGAIGNDFLVPTQAFNNESIVVVNTTNPAPDSIKWVLPAAAVISQQSSESVTFTIANPGSYDIKLITYGGQCIAEQTQKIIVSKPADLNSTGSTANPFVTSFVVSPNPNSGTFRVQVQLQTQANIQLSLLNISSNTIQSIGKYSGAANYDIPVSYALSSGVYVLLLETPNGSRTFKIIVL